MINESAHQQEIQIKALEEKVDTQHSEHNNVYSQLMTMLTMLNKK